jgi:hypothetical protein
MRSFVRRTAKRGRHKNQFQMSSSLRAMREFPASMFPEVFSPHERIPTSNLHAMQYAFALDAK